MPEPISVSPQFSRAAMVASMLGVGRLTCGLELQTLAQLGHGLDPRAVPIEALQAMGTHPTVYISQRTLTGIIQRPDLFSIDHKDPAIAAEASAWLYPLLPTILAGAARAFDYGSCVIVFDVGREPLVYWSAASPDVAERKRTAVDLTRYVDAFEIRPDYCVPQLGRDGRIEALAISGQTYSRDRIHVWTWDPEFGDLCGQGARRRAWTHYCEDLIISLLESKYLERSVDPVRQARAPAGPAGAGITDEDGKPMKALDFMMGLVSGVRGGGVLGLPSDRDAEGNYYYDLETVELPDRSEVWEKGIVRRRASIMLAYLCTPQLGGLDEVGTLDGRTLDGMLREFIDDLATWTATGLTKILERVHRANYDPAKVPPPSVRPTDVGKSAARRMLKELLALANSQPQGELAQRFDVPKALDHLGAPVRPADQAPDLPDAPDAGQAPGRKQDATSDRQDRRDASPTDQGAQDTGGETVDGEPRPGGAA